MVFLLAAKLLRVIMGGMEIAKWVHWKGGWQFVAAFGMVCLVGLGLKVGIDYHAERTGRAAVKALFEGFGNGPDSAGSRETAAWRERVAAAESVYDANESILENIEAMQKMGGATAAEVRDAEAALDRAMEDWQAVIDSH